MTWVRCVVVLLILSAVGVAQAEGGNLSLRSGYYKERSTRVIQPMIDADFSHGDDSFSGHVLVDSITSASAAAGSAVEFTERRYEGGLGWSHDFGRASLGGLVRASTEDDYTSYWGAVSGSLALADKNTILSLTIGRGYDTITNGVVAGPSVPAIEHHLQTGLTSVGISQIFGPRLVGNLGLDLMDLHGYQANVYRRVFGATTPAEERVPDLRLRLAISAGLRWYLAPSRSTVIASYRYYDDDWGIVAHTAELRVVQNLVPGLDLRLRYRFYTQTGAAFYEDRYGAGEIMDPASYITDDQKLEALTTHTAGLQLAAALGLFGMTGSWADARVDLSVERVWQDDLFGNAWVAQAGVTVPFGED
jgi:hypothetical protein